MKEPSPALPGIQLSACILATAFIGTLLPLITAASHPDENYSSIYEGAGSSYLRPRSGLVDNIFTNRLLQETCNETCCEQFQKTCSESSANPFGSVPLWGQIVMMVVLLGFSALFSGLNLGLMSLDKTGLEIVIGGDDEKYREMAKKIYPIRENGNLLLCTLLLGNVSVNALLSILLADKAGGIVGFLASTFLIVIVGEIIPQAACSRYALEIGSKTVPLVRVIIILFWPIAFPLAWALDKALGQELATTYSNAEMLKLLQIHVQEEKIDKDTANAMTGALKFRDMAVKDVMTPLANAFMLSVEEKLNFETIAKIFKTGYSRIPVYEINKVRLLTR
jgi:CBS domain containing-hemolysin-like protein